MTKTLEQTMAFEDFVRRVAEAVWRLGPGEVQPAWYRDDPVLRELDGIARLPDVTHLLMVTTSTRLQKVKEDVFKLGKAERKEKARGCATKQWLITQAQLNAEHIDHARKYGVETLTIDQFRDRFFNGRDYIAKRRNGMFGSSRNLRDGGVTIPDDEYIDLPLAEFRVDFHHGRRADREHSINLAELTERLDKGERFCLLGPFGAGKSLTTREVFFHLAERFLDGSSRCVPLAINLREHWGAIYADEVLERHARSIGFSPRETLTVAWRAGIGHLLLDGFDEVATQVIATPSDRNFMRKARDQALQAVRDLIRGTPSSVGILICGRDHYFDSAEEMRDAIGLQGRQFSIVRIGEFTEDKARAFLAKHATTTLLPDWLPRKPLLLGYLAHQQLLDSVLSIEPERGFGFIWDSFLRLICEREAEHRRAVMDPKTIRRVLERLSCIARGSVTGNGPISGLDLAEAYRLEAGDVAGEGVLMQLQRLPGLTQRDQDPTARSFVDPDLLAALQGSAVSRAILESDSGLAARRWIAGLPAAGVQMGAFMLEVAGLTCSSIIDITRRFTVDGNTKLELQQLALDSFLVAMDVASDRGSLDGRGLLLADANATLINLEELSVNNITLRGCVVDELMVGQGLSGSTIHFESCAFLKVSGVPAEQGLPAGQFSRCEFSEFDDASTNAAILRSDLPVGLKALMTVLRKVYVQAGTGRKLSALKRGIPAGGKVFEAVDPVVHLLQSEGIISVFGQIVHPVRKHAPRVHKILSAGALSDDLLVAQARSL